MTAISKEIAPKGSADAEGDVEVVPGRLLPSFLPYFGISSAKFGTLC